MKPSVRKGNVHDTIWDAEHPVLKERDFMGNLKHINGTYWKAGSGWERKVGTSHGAFFCIKAMEERDMLQAVNTYIG